MKFGVVVFPGSNCDRDVQDAIANDLHMEMVPLWHKDHDLSAFSKDDCIVLPGGFSYGDYLRCGAIARFSPIMKEVIRFAEGGGKVLGICNGFQILCETGLLPGALLRNENQQFVCKNVHIRNEATAEVLCIPVAHGEGRYYASGDVLDQLHKNGQVIYRYCSADGKTDNASNPNGSLENIAAIKNKQGNVFGMMPHPERATSKLLKNTDGIRVFEHLFQVLPAAN